MKHRFLTTLALAASLMLTAVMPAQAAYPDKPVTMIIAFTAGGSSDVQARIMEKYWNKYVPQQKWVFVYKPGAGGAIGFGEIAMARKDGYTIGGINIPHLVIQALTQKAQFKVDDFDYICQVVNDPQCVVVRKDSQIKSAKELFDYAKANPGKLKVGLVGPNSGHHLMYLDAKKKLGFPVTEVFYKGAADQNAALLGGEIDAMFGNLNDVMRSLEEMNVLALAAEKRNDFLPNVPTLKEQGYNILSDIRRAFVAPKGIPAADLAFLRETFKKICMDPDYLKDMKTAGQPAEYLDGAALYKHMQSLETEIRSAFAKK
ncbi:MAG: tripartite tricarboxylate transporter substrate binding protein [Desulfovibrio sp.]|jgi:tripartite-type tricarboxylate transporter receptor subunit TctC|nr:tripartite tricarboxylate transporter substrate binding protein [Desulfovibrio sp.]